MAAIVVPAKPPVEELWLYKSTYGGTRTFKRVGDLKSTWAGKTGRGQFFYINFLAITPTWIEVFQDEGYLPFPEPSSKLTKAQIRAQKLNEFGNGGVR